ncbi:hypothetical protein ACPPVW_18195 [Leifsonia sp. McL0607]|uniref:hypothetical protein n=1 Tax=Leifsonia sp. McL0607 TaxID=3415672 RepID=UPI003CF24CE2
MPPRLPRELSASQLDEMLAPIAALIADPRDCEPEALLILERLAYLVSRGPARDGRAEFLKSINVSAMTLFLEDIRHDTPDGAPNWFRLAQVLGRDPRSVRKAFSGWIAPTV